MQVIYRKPTGSPGGNTSSVSTKNIRVHPFSGDCSFRVSLEKGEAVSRQPVVVVGGMHMGRVGYTKEGYVGAASMAVTLLNSGTAKEDVDERGNVLAPVLQVKDLSHITPEQINAVYVTPPLAMAALGMMAAQAVKAARAAPCGVEQQPSAQAQQQPHPGSQPDLRPNEGRLLRRAGRVQAVRAHHALARSATVPGGQLVQRGTGGEVGRGRAAACVRPRPTTYCSDARTS